MNDNKNTEALVSWDYRTVLNLSHKTKTIVLGYERKQPQCYDNRQAYGTATFSSNSCNLLPKT